MRSNQSYSLSEFTDILTEVGVALLGAGLNEHWVVSVIFLPCRPDQLIFVNDHPVLEVSSGDQKLVVISPVPFSRPGLRVIGGISIGFLCSSSIKISGKCRDRLGLHKLHSGGRKTP